MICQITKFPHPITVPTEKPHVFRLKEDYVYCFFWDNKHYKVIVPSGFKTDLASVPRIFWGLIPPDGLYRGAVVLHDKAYNGRGVLDVYEHIDGHWHPSDKVFNRYESDTLLFHEPMKAAGVHWWPREPMYASVRTFGWFAWVTD